VAWLNRLEIDYDNLTGTDVVAANSISSRLLAASSIVRCGTGAAI
jgi:hypothetical protein